MAARAPRHYERRISSASASTSSSSESSPSSYISNGSRSTARTSLGSGHRHAEDDDVVVDETPDVTTYTLCRQKPRNIVEQPRRPQARALQPQPLRRAPPPPQAYSTDSVYTYGSSLRDEVDSALADTTSSSSSSSSSEDYTEEEDSCSPSSSSDEDDEDAYEDDEERDLVYDADRKSFLPPSAGDAIPPVLPPYRAAVPEPCVRPSNPEFFARLFPSLDRFSVRHDELTPDGNMNLRVDALVVPPPIPSAPGHGHGSGGRRAMPPVPVQLFHLRMRDLARRDFSLRRYCRESGREVCSSRREYVQPGRAGAGANGLQRSVSALRSVRGPFRRSTSSSSSSTNRPGSRRQHSVSSFGSDRDRTQPPTSAPSTSAPAASSSSSSSVSAAPMLPPPPQLVPTQTIKLEFSNYARVDVTRRGRGGHYGFEWWGHRYVWRRVVDRDVEGGPVSFHLYRDAGRRATSSSRSPSRGSAVAHIVPETRSPSQVAAEEAAGGWIPPYHLYISDPSVLAAVTDVADVIVATGLVSLVDDCIKQRWGIPPKKRSLRRSTTTNSSSTASTRADSFTSGFNAGFNAGSGPGSRPPRSNSFMQGLFSRRPSVRRRSSPLRFGQPVAAC